MNNEITAQLLFKRVDCKSYYKKIKDGRFIYFIPERDSERECDEYYYCGLDENGIPFEKECNADGARDFLKTYYQKTEKPFRGIVVGVISLLIKAYLVAEYQEDPYSGRGFTQISREPEEMATVAIVYYGNNRKRFVSIEDLEVMKEEK